MKKKQRSPIHAYKQLLANDHDWDYAYLIALERKKLQRMRDCIKQEHHLANNEFVVREIEFVFVLLTSSWKKMLFIRHGLNVLTQV